MRSFLGLATVIVCAAVFGGLGVAAQSNTQSRQDKNDKNTDHVTVTGCLSANPASKLYVLTTTPKGMADAAGAVANAPTTITYELSGGNGLQNEVGSEIEVVGTTDRGNVKTVESETKQSGAPRNGQTSDAKPKVQTKTETKVAVRALHVESFRHIASNCKPTAQ